MHFSLILTSEQLKVLAYLDPGSGSIILQLAVGALLGIGIFVRSQWSRIKSLFKKKNVPGKDDLDDKDES